MIIHNPYREQALAELRADMEAGRKKPLPTVGNVRWFWYGRTWLMRSKDFQERNDRAIVISLVFDKLTGFVTENDIGRGYNTEAEAMDALRKAFSAVCAQYPTADEQRAAIDKKYAERSEW